MIVLSPHRQGEAMLFFKSKSKEPVQENRKKTNVTFEEILKQAYRVGRFSPLQSQCSPAPALVPVWVENNRAILSPIVARFFETYEIPDSRKVEILEEIQKGYAAMINSGPAYEGDGSNAFLFSKKQVIDLSNEMFRSIAVEIGVSQAEIDSNPIFTRGVFLALSKQAV